MLLDTDIGSDIDDAVALAYLLRQPACELLGVTTVTGDVQKRAALAEVICRAADRPHIPIHCGKRDVLIDGPGQPGVPQYEAIAHIPHKLDRPENTAVEFLRDTIRRRPHEITLLTIGPLSNVAVLFALDPEVPRLLKAVVSMCGVFYQGSRREWNALVDPAATAIMYGASEVDHVSVGLDVTEKCRLAASEVRRRFVGQPLGTVALLAETWFKSAGEVTFHDPLAATLVFHPGLCSFESGRVDVAYQKNGENSGHTSLITGPGHDRVANEVDADAFFREYFSVFS